MAVSGQGRFKPLSQRPRALNRSPISCLALVACLLSAPLHAQQYFTADIANDHFTEWTGTASLSAGSDGRVSGELCIVRKEYVNRAVWPRTLLRIPITGRYDGDLLKLSIPKVPDGPDFEKPEVTLSRGGDGQHSDGIESWGFNDRRIVTDFSDDEPATEIDEPDTAEMPPPSQEEESRTEEEEGVGISEEEEARLLAKEPRSEFVRYFRLGWGDLVTDVSTFKNPDEASLIVLRQPVDEKEEEPEQSYIFLKVFDQMTPEQASAFIQKQVWVSSNLPEERVVQVFADTGRFQEIQNALGELGHGARILNFEIKDCQPSAIPFVVTVPDRLELWYARRLQTSGLVKAAYPAIQMMDPSFSTAFTLGSTAIAAAIRNPQFGDSEKIRVVWQEFDRLLRSFIERRRPGFRSDGRIARPGSNTGFIFSADISGRALAVCDPKRWEMFTVTAAANSFDRRSGKVTIAVNFTDGFYANGDKRPAESRWKENSILEGPLQKLQDLFLGVLQGNTNSVIKC